MAVETKEYWVIIPFATKSGAFSAMKHITPYESFVVEREAGAYRDEFLSREME